MSDHLYDWLNGDREEREGKTGACKEIGFALAPAQSCFIRSVFGAVELCSCGGAYSRYPSFGVLDQRPRVAPGAERPSRPEETGAHDARACFRDRRITG